MKRASTKKRTPSKPVVSRSGFVPPPTRLVDEVVIAIAPIIIEHYTHHLPDYLDGGRAGALRMGSLIYAIAQGVVDEGKRRKYETANAQTHFG